MFLQAYRLACHYGDTEEEVHETMKISSSAVFNKLMLFVLKEADHIFLRMLSLDEQPAVTARDVQKSKRLKKMESLLKSFLGNSLHLLGMNNTRFGIVAKHSSVSMQEGGEQGSLHCHWPCHVPLPLQEQQQETTNTKAGDDLPASRLVFLVLAHASPKPHANVNDNPLIPMPVIHHNKTP